MNWKIFFKIFLTDRDTFFKFIAVVDESIFKSNVMTNVFILIKKFFSKYKKLPTIDILTLFLEKMPLSEKENLAEYTAFLKEIEELKVDIDIEAFQDELLRVIKNYEVEKFILKTANKIEHVSFEDILTDVREIATKFEPKSAGVDVTNVERAIKQIRHDVQDKVTTGMPSLDKLLYGGFGTGEICILMAPAGRGKSFWLLNSMYGAMLGQKNTLYITYELYEKSVLRRLYSRIAYASKKELMDEEQVARAANRFFTLAKSKSRIIYAPSRSMTVEGIENTLEQQYIYFDFVPDIIFVDYLDLISPRAADMRLEMRHRLQAITEDLRSLAIRRNIPLVTVTQASRTSLNKIKMTEAHISESYGKVMVSDVLLGLMQTDEEKQAKRARIGVLKNRDYVSGGCIEVYVDFEKMLLLDLESAAKQGLLESAENAK